MLRKHEAIAWWITVIALIVIGLLMITHAFLDAHRRERVYIYRDTGEVQDPSIGY